MGWLGWLAVTPNVLLFPSSPALVPELAPADGAARQLLRVARRALARYSPSRIDVVGSLDDRWRTSRTGSFRGWGAPQITVAGGEHLAELIARYVLGPELERRIGSVRERFERPGADLTIVVTDGSAGMTARAPLALLEGAEAADQWCRGVLSGEQVHARSVAELHAAGVADGALWAELASVEKHLPELLAADTSTGVARYVAAWGMV